MNDKTTVEYEDFLNWTYLLAHGSPDPSTQNGAILLGDNGSIIGRGINDFPVGVKRTSSRWERPLKYSFVEHAERNAIFNAAYHGNPTLNSTLICGWAACSDCARAIIQSGISRLVRHKDASNQPSKVWKNSIELADAMLAEANVQIIEIEGKITPSTFTILRSGKLWSP